MRRTIAYISSFLPSRSETFVYREIRELRRRGWNVVCVSLKRPKDNLPELADIEAGRVIVYDASLPGGAIAETLAHPIRAVSTSLRALGDMISPGETLSLGSRLMVGVQKSASAVSLARQLRARGVQHIHCHFAHSPTTVGMYTAARMGVPFSFTGHANDIFQRRRLLRRKLQRAKFVCCISEWHREFYREIEPTAAGKLAVVRCGVNTDEWDAQPRSAESSPLRMLTVCRLVEKKGIDLLIDGLSKFSATDPQFDWQLTIAGEGPQMSSLVAAANRSGISERIRFLGAVSNDRVRELLGETDLFALPCRTDSHGDRDGIPVVLMEAMAAGVPVIAGDLPAVRELVENSVSGSLVHAEDTAAVARAISEFAHMSLTKRQQVGQAGRRRVVEEFSLAENVSRLEKMLAASVDCGMRIADCGLENASLNPQSEIRNPQSMPRRTIGETVQ